MLQWLINWLSPPEYILVHTYEVFVKEPFVTPYYVYEHPRRGPIQLYEVIKGKSMKRKAIGDINYMNYNDRRDVEIWEKTGYFKGKEMFSCYEQERRLKRINKGYND